MTKLEKMAEEYFKVDSSAYHAFMAGFLTAREMAAEIVKYEEGVCFGISKLGDEVVEEEK